MEENFPRYTDYPPDFRSETLEKITGFIKKGKSHQLIGPTGSGKSTILKILSYSPQILKNYFKSEYSKINVIYLDLNLIPEKEPASLLKLLHHRISESPTGTSRTEVVEKLEYEIEKKLKEYQKIVICLDYTEKIIDMNFRSFFEILGGLYYQNRKRLVFIFSFNSPPENLASILPHGEFGYDILENRIFVPGMNIRDTAWFMNILSKNLGFVPDKKILTGVFKASGGYMSTVKRLSELISDKHSLKEILGSPTAFLRLNYNFELLLDDLSKQSATIQNLLNGNLSETDAENIKYLSNISLFDIKGNPNNLLFYEFLKKKIPGYDGDYETLHGDLHINVRLTASEFKVIKYLTDKMGVFVAKDELIEDLWGNKAPGGISNHALDQIIYRLRKKLTVNNSPVKIETVWGRGHKAILTNQPDKFHLAK